MRLGDLDRPVDAVFLSMSWGGVGYSLLNEFGLDNLHPDFDTVLKKALSYSSNLAIYLPRNTSIIDLVARLSRTKIVGPERL
jgi:hypothetical protein